MNGPFGPISGLFYLIPVPERNFFFEALQLNEKQSQFGAVPSSHGCDLVYIQLTLVLTNSEGTEQFSSLY